MNHHDTTLIREIPRDNQAEQATLGAILLNPDALTDVATIITPDDFYNPLHRVIYDAALDLWNTTGTIDPVLVAAHLDKNDNLNRIGGAPYLHTLIEAVPTAHHATRYATVVAEHATLRRIATAGEEIANLGYHNDGHHIDDLIAQAQQTVNKISSHHHQDTYQTLTDLLAPTLEELDNIANTGGLAQGVPTGFRDLDNITNGLHGGQMIIIAARPGVGKSTIGLDLMRSCSITHGKTSAIFSLEMSKSEIVMRLLSAEASIKLADMRAGRMTDTNWTNLATTVEKIANAPLIIDDSADLTIGNIRAKATQIKQQQGLDLVVIDYLQLMTSGKHTDNRQQEVSDFSRQIKLLAKELNIPIIAISQLNRGPEQRTDKRPQLSDLRESGSLEQDADIVILLNRPDSQDREHQKAGEAEIIIAKHRGGPIDTINVAHQLHFSRFTDMPHTNDYTP